MTTPNLTGRIAITVANQLGLTLNKYADPTGDARMGLSIEEAHEIAKHDPSLLWLDDAQVAAAISESQICELLHKAQDNDNVKLSDICYIAMAEEETSDYGRELVDYDGVTWTRTAARVECARVIAEARGRR